ncbi:MAG: DNA-3-methyladenine glycosylase [Patescibacteria group bacterium]
MSILTKKFFERPTLKVAQELLGKFLFRRIGGKKFFFAITEVEAYDGFLDKASHAHKGKTARNTPMFGEAGIWYVYLVYGMHNMLNIVTGPKNYPAAVLIRVIKPLSNSVAKLNGPAKLTKFLGIDKKFNKKPATRAAGLWIEDKGVKIKKSQIKASPRIGVNYAGEWKDKNYRFYL